MATEAQVKAAATYLSKIKIQIFTRKKLTFFQSVLFGLKVKWEESIGMLATDAEYLIINPVYWVTRTIDGAITDLIHEVMHIILNHCQRCVDQSLNFKKYNYAADYVINLMLKELGLTVDSTFIYDRKYKGMSTEQVYALIPDPPEDYKPDVISSLGDKTPKEVDEQVKRLISVATVQTEMQDAWSDMPANIKRLIDELLNPTVDWVTQLSEFMTAFDNTDYSYIKRNRRYSDFCMPTLYNEGMGAINFYIDASGSIGQKEYRKALSECQGVINVLKPKEVLVYNWGTNLGEPVTIPDEANILDHAQLVNMGGTNVNPVLKDINDKSPEVSVILTDGYFSKPKIDVNSPVLWLIFGNKKFTSDIGRIIHYEDTPN